MSNSLNGPASAGRTGRIRIDRERLWQSHLNLARFGAGPNGGMNRLALTKPDKAARDTFARWCRDAGCVVRIDQMGNIFARRAGEDPRAAPVISGSHLDTQATGGMFDGIYGVLATLEVIRSLNEASCRTVHPIEAVVWTNEEGVRFSPAMTGSGVWAGEIAQDDAHRQTDGDGISLLQALEEIGYRGDDRCVPFPICGAFEAHIEQGPVLEAAGTQIGVVTGVQGLRWADVVIDGRTSHAGTTPMDARHDPVRAFSGIAEALYRMADAYKPNVRLTIGRLESVPGAYNTVPGRVVFGIDLRHPEEMVLENIFGTIKAIVRDVCEDFQVTGEVHQKLAHLPVVFDADVVASVREAARDLVLDSSIASLSSCRVRGYQKAGRPTHSATQLRHASIGRRRRYSNHQGAARACEPRDHRFLHHGRNSNRTRGHQSAGQVDDAARAAGGSSRLSRCAPRSRSPISSVAPGPRIAQPTPGI